MTNTRTAAVMVAFMLALATAACGGGGGAPQSLDVSVENFAFPADLVVAPGGEVTFTTTDQEPHKVQAEDGSFETDAFGPSQAAEASMTAPDSPGSYAFRCALHPSMTGTLRVQ